MKYETGKCVAGRLEFRPREQLEVEAAPSREIPDKRCAGYGNERLELWMLQRSARPVP